MNYQGSLPRVLFVLHHQNNIPPKDVRIVGHLRNLSMWYIPQEKNCLIISIDTENYLAPLETERNSLKLIKSIY